MTKEEIRAFVLEVMEDELHRQGGVYDHCRSTAFEMLRSVLVDEANARLKSFQAGLQ